MKSFPIDNVHAWKHADGSYRLVLDGQILTFSPDPQSVRHHAKAYRTLEEIEGCQRKKS